MRPIEIHLAKRLSITSIYSETELVDEIRYLSNCKFKDHQIEKMMEIIISLSNSFGFSLREIIHRFIY